MLPYVLKGTCICQLSHSVASKDVLLGGKGDKGQLCDGSIYSCRRAPLARVCPTRLPILCQLPPASHSSCTSVSQAHRWVESALCIRLRQALVSASRLSPGLPLTPRRTRALLCLLLVRPCPPTHTHFLRTQAPSRSPAACSSSSATPCPSLPPFPKLLGTLPSQASGNCKVRREKRERKFATLLLKAGGVCFPPPPVHGN